MRVLFKKEKEQILTFKKLEPGNVTDDFGDKSVIKIAGILIVTRILSSISNIIIAHLGKKSKLNKCIIPKVNA